VIDHLSPREIEDLDTAMAGGESWPHVVLAFVHGTRLALGWDRALPEAAIARLLAAAGATIAGTSTVGAAPSAQDACRRAARWCAEHGLHLLPFEGSGPGEDPVGERVWFMAVG
jgi:hypothetical protein